MNVFIAALGPSNIDVEVFDVEIRINIRSYPLSLDNFLQFNIDEVIKGINVLFDQPLVLEESR